MHALSSRCCFPAQLTEQLHPVNQDLSLTLQLIYVNVKSLSTSMLMNAILPAQKEHTLTENSVKNAQMY